MIECHPTKPITHAGVKWTALYHCSSSGPIEYCKSSPQIKPLIYDHSIK